MKKSIKKILVFVLTLSMMFSNLVIAEDTVKNQTETNELQEYIAVVVNDEAQEELQEIVKNDDSINDISPVQLEESQISIIETTEEQAQELDEIQGVVIEEDVIISANDVVPVDIELSEELAEEGAELNFSQWNVDAVGLTDNVQATGEGVKVAVLDSGVSYTTDVMVAGYKDFVMDLGDDFNPLFDDSTGHGTGIAGVIAADGVNGNIKGIAPGGELYSVKVLDWNNEAPLSRIIEGIYWCIEQEYDIINMSFGIASNSVALKQAIDAAEASGIIMIAAAGNRGAEAESVDYPAAYDNVIAVGASDGENAMATFTSDGDGIDVLAPGEKVWTNSTLQGLMAVDGTSIATAHVTAATALLLEVYPAADVEYIKQLLKASSVMAVGEADLGIMNIEEALSMAETFEAQESTEITPQTDVVMDTYDTEGIVTGCWGSTKHGESVPTLASTDQQRIMSGMAAYVDLYFPAKLTTDYNNFDNDSDTSNGGYGILHAQHNYVAALHLLYKIARQTDTAPYTLYDKNEATAFLSGYDTTHTKDTICWSSDLADVREAIVLALSYGDIRDKNGNKLGESIADKLKASNKVKKGYLIMGFAIHLMGDIYAHRTLVPTTACDKTSTGYILKQSDFTDWSDFEARVEDFVVEFRDIKEYMRTPSGATYEDKATFYPERYTATESSVASLIKRFNNDKGFDLQKFLGSQHGLDRKLNNFINYAVSNGMEAAEAREAFEDISTIYFKVDVETEAEVKTREKDYKDYQPCVFYTP